MKITVNIDTKEFKKKPEKNMVGSISWRMEKNVEEMMIEELADAVGNKGRTLIRARMNAHRCREDFLEQSLLALDFDDGITYKEFKTEYERYRIFPVFTYKTFSYKRSNERFRAVFLMDETITHAGFAETMNRLIQKVFPKADRQCTDLARMLYGGFTSLCRIEGGKKLFMDCQGEDSSKWRRNWEKDALKYPILKCGCKAGVCPYWKECMAESLYDKLKNGIRRIGEPEDYLSVDAVYEALKCTLRECIQEKGELIHVIKAQTAIGKTQAYSEVIAEQKDKKFIVAVPSSILQEEVCQRLEENGIVCYKTLNLYEEIRALGIESLAEMIQEMYEKGYGRYEK